MGKGSRILVPLFSCVSCFPDVPTAEASDRHFCLANKDNNMHNTLLSKYQGLGTMRAFKVADMLRLARQSLSVLLWGKEIWEDVPGDWKIWALNLGYCDSRCCTFFFFTASLHHYSIYDTGCRTMAKRPKKELHFSLRSRPGLPRGFSSITHPGTQTGHVACCAPASGKKIVVLSECAQDGDQGFTCIHLHLNLTSLNILMYQWKQSTVVSAWVARGWGEMKGQMGIGRQLSLLQPGDLHSGSTLHIHGIGIARNSGRKVVKKA